MVGRAPRGVRPRAPQKNHGGHLLLSEPPKVAAPTTEKVGCQYFVSKFLCTLEGMLLVLRLVFRGRKSTNCFVNSFAPGK